MDESGTVEAEYQSPSLDEGGKSQLQHGDRVVERIGRVADYRWKYNRILHLEDDGDDEADSGEEQTASEMCSEDEEATESEDGQDPDLEPRPPGFLISDGPAEDFWEEASSLGLSPSSFLLDCILI